MTTNQLVEQARMALEKYLALPDEEKKRRLIALGTINEQGEVLMGLQEAKEQEAQEKNQAASPNGVPPSTTQKPEKGTAP